jgi:hypothetical protein
MSPQIPSVRVYSLTTFKAAIVAAVLYFAAAAHGPFCLWEACLGVIYFCCRPEWKTPPMLARLGCSSMKLPFAWEVAMGICLVCFYRPPSPFWIAILAFVTVAIALSACVKLTVRTKRLLARHA